MDRLDSGFCVKCGGVLIDLKAPLQMCTECIKWAEAKTAEKLKGGIPGKKIKMRI